MMIDASAIVAVLNGEPDAAALAAAIDGARAPFTSPIAIYEATVALMRENKLGGEEAAAIVRALVEEASISVVAIDDAVAASAIRAFDRFGKGRHPAQLNTGDCFAYACARAHEAPLLFKGEDFPRTDIVNALNY